MSQSIATHRDWIHTPTSPQSTRTPQPQEAVLHLYYSSSAQEAIHPPPHWSRVLHHNSGPNQYKSCVFVLRVRRVHPRDLSELRRGSVGRKSSRAPQCLNLEGFAGTRDPTFGAPGRGTPELPFCRFASNCSVVSMADARRVRAERRATLATRIAQTAPVVGPPTGAV